MLKTRKSSFIDQPSKKIIVGVAGGSAAGKTTLCENINRQMAFDRNFKVEIISLDSFYKNVDKQQVDITQYNFDHPNALDFDLAYKTLKSLKQSNQPVAVPQYSFIKHARQSQPVIVGPANIIFFEGLMAFYDERIRKLLTYKIFINCDDDIRLCRRLKRDTTERGRSIISVLDQYNKFVKNAFRDFILPSIAYADIIIPGFRNNRVSVDFIVQHIKNIARMIIFKEHASKRKTFIFGESAVYDLQYTDNYEKQAALSQQSFLVFPTSDQHKRELDFFLTSLLSEIFSVQYFLEVYTQQFIKILKHLVRQLITLKNFKNEQMEILSIYNLEQSLQFNDNTRPIKLIFFPVAEVEYSTKILTKIKNYIQKYPKVTFVILNCFCEMQVPEIIYKFKLNNVILVNLFVIANDKRFKQIMSNNILITTDNFDWFMHNHEISNTGCDILVKEFNFFRRTQSDISELCYDMEIKKQGKERPHIYIEEALEKVGIIQQHNVYCQEHDNLCGFHALCTLICLESNKNILCKKTFINNYHMIANSLENVNYQPLERSKIDDILHSKLFEIHNNIGVLIFSFKYIQNSEDQMEKLQELFTDLNDERRKQIYVIMGVVDHYVLLKVSKQRIDFYDSNNTSLRDIWNGTYIQRQNEYKQNSQEDNKNYKNRIHNLKQALDIVIDLLNNKKLTTILIQKRLEDIIGSFNLIKSDQKAVQYWLQNEYPKAVIEQDLLKIMREKKLLISESHKKQFHEWFTHPAISALFPQNQKNFY